MTVRDIIKGSLRKLGVLASGEEPSAEEASDALEALNTMLDSWGIERLFVYSVVEQVFSLQAGKQTYTMGPGGDFDGPRPAQVEEAYIRYTPGGTPTPDLPIRVLTQPEWASIVVKQQPSTFPTRVYPDYGPTTVTLSFWPVPQISVPVAMWVWGAILSQLESINDDVVVPPGYARALIYNLAVELAPEYGRDVSIAVATIATEAKANVKRINMPDLLMAVDPALVPEGGRYSILTDGYIR